MAHWFILGSQFKVTGEGSAFKTVGTISSEGFYNPRCL